MIYSFYMFSIFLYDSFLVLKTTLYVATLIHNYFLYTPRIPSKDLELQTPRLPRNPGHFIFEDL